MHASVGDRAAKLGVEPHSMSRRGTMHRIAPQPQHPLPMPSIKGFTCSLTIDGNDEPAVEYGAQQEGPDYASAYVVAESLKRFSLTVSATEYVYPAMDVAVWIDGKYQDGRIMSQSEGKFTFKEKFTGKEEKQGRKMVKKLWGFGEMNVGGFSLTYQVT